MKNTGNRSERDGRVHHARGKCLKMYSSAVVNPSEVAQGENRALDMDKYFHLGMACIYTDE